MIIISPRMRKWSRWRDSHSRGALRPAVYETAAVATEPHRRNGGSPRICTVFHPGKSRSFTIKVCDPRRDAKAELNRRSQACEVLADTGISRRVKWTGMRVARPLFRFGRPACISQHLCPEKWNPVLESHQPLQFCKPPPELLSQRDEKVNLLILEPGQTRRNSPSSRLKSCYSDGLRNFWSHSASAGSSTIAQEWGLREPSGL